MADIETSVVISAQTDELQSGMEAAANSVQAATDAMRAQFAGLGAAAGSAIGIAVGAVLLYAGFVAPAHIRAAFRPKIAPN
jgi:hypothetical protein